MVGLRVTVEREKARWSWFLEGGRICRSREREEELVVKGDDGEGIISCDFLFFFHLFS